MVPVFLSSPSFRGKAWKYYEEPEQLGLATTDDQRFRNNLRNNMAISLDLKLCSFELSAGKISVHHQTKRYDYDGDDKEEINPAAVP